MSVLMNAMETAKRERARRASQGASSMGLPVLVPLRSMPKSRRESWKIVAFSATGVVIIAIGAAAFFKGPKSASLPTVPPVTSTILSEALAADSVRRNARPVANTRTPASDTSRSIATGPRAPQVPQPISSSTTPAAVLVSRDTIVTPQGQPAAPVQPDRRVTSAGRLRVAVEQPGQPEAARLFADAVLAHRSGDLATARRLYERVLALSPTDVDALNNLGVLLSAQLEYGRALDLLRRAASIAPRNAGVWNNIGAVFHQQGKNGDAIAAFRHALTIDSMHLGAKVGLAQQYLAISSLAPARELLDEVIAANPKMPEAHYTLGQVLELQGDRGGAVRAYETFIKTAPARLANHRELVRRRIDALSR